MARQGTGKRSKAVAKRNLPQKDCATCGRPFAWRKKWARDWDAVRFCSERCRRARSNRRAMMPKCGAAADETERTSE